MLPCLRRIGDIGQFAKTWESLWLFPTKSKTRQSLLIWNEHLRDWSDDLGIIASRQNISQSDLKKIKNMKMISHLIHNQTWNVEISVLDYIKKGSKRYCVHLGRLVLFAHFKLDKQKKSNNFYNCRGNWIRAGEEAKLWWHGLLLKR